MLQFTSDSKFFFLLFQKKWVGRAMGNDTFYGDGLTQLKRAQKLFKLVTDKFFRGDMLGSSSMGAVTVKTKDNPVKPETVTANIQ